MTRITQPLRNIVHRRYMQNQTHLPRDIRICFIGDSFVSGAGDSTHQGWPSRICAQSQQTLRCDITHYSLGIRRNTSRDVLHRWHEEGHRRMPSDHPDQVERKVVFSFGVNDCVEELGQCRVTSTETIENLRTLLKEVPENWSVIVVGPPPSTGQHDNGLNERIKALNEKMRKTCELAGTSFISVFEELNQNQVWRKEAAAGDGIHPSAEGYALLSELVWRSEAWTAWIES